MFFTINGENIEADDDPDPGHDDGSDDDENGEDSSEDGSEDGERVQGTASGGGPNLARENPKTETAMSAVPALAPISPGRTGFAIPTTAYTTATT